MIAMAGVANSLADMPPPSGLISGTIYDNLKVAPANVPSGGTKQPVRVIAVGSGVHREVLSDTTGLYRIDKLPPGPYRLQFAAADAYAWSVDDVLVCAHFETVQDTSSPRMHAKIMSVMIRSLPNAAGDLSVHVAAQDGRAIAGAEVTLTHLADGTGSAASTESDGSYRFMSLQPGEYSLDITGAGFVARKVSKVIIGPGDHHVMTERLCGQS